VKGGWREEGERVKESARRSMNTIPNPDPNPRSPEPSSADVAEAGGVGSSRNLCVEEERPTWWHFV